jgi:hypothetical protein
MKWTNTIHTLAAKGVMIKSGKSSAVEACEK